MEFKNEYKSTRSGFSHTSRLYSDTGDLISEATCRYINRTWESYHFQSSMKAAVLKAIDSEIEKQKNLQGIKRLTQKKKEEIINYSSTIAQLKEKYRTL